jgi:flagellar motor switch/type III secretory pathway protein FliN
MATALALPTQEESKISATAWIEAGWLPCGVTVEIAVPGFTVGDLLSLGVNSVVVTRTASSGELIVRANGEMLGKAEVYIDGKNFAARLTEFA